VLAVIDWLMAGRPWEISGEMRAMPALELRRARPTWTELQCKRLADNCAARGSSGGEAWFVEVHQLKLARNESFADRPSVRPATSRRASSAGVRHNDVRATVVCSEIYFSARKRRAMRGSAGAERLREANRRRIERSVRRGYVKARQPCLGARLPLAAPRLVKFGLAEPNCGASACSLPAFSVPGNCTKRAF
jgi:hypothetical protein